MPDRRPGAWELRVSGATDPLLDEVRVRDVSLLRLRHGVVTFLIDGTHLVKAQQRLGHHDTATTFRGDAHAPALEDQDVADTINALLSDANQVMADA